MRQAFAVGAGLLVALPASAAVHTGGSGCPDDFFLYTGLVLGLGAAGILALFLPLRRQIRVPVGLALWAAMAVSCATYVRANSFMCCGSQIDTTRLIMGKVAQQIEIYGIRKGYPVDLQQVFPDGMPRDAWNNEFLYVTPGPDGRPFDVISLGEDGAYGGTGADADVHHSDDFR
jgi:general secretion pathway protein G